jgi:hypothetical protein
VYTISLKQMGQGSNIELRGVEGERTFPFTVRSDEVITSAKIRYGIAYSPALLPDLSHIKVSVNNELVSVVPLPKDNPKASSAKIISIHGFLQTLISSVSN